MHGQVLMAPEASGAKPTATSLGRDEGQRGLIDQPIRVLCVDDDPTALHLLTAILRQEGFGTVCAKSVAEANHLAAEGTYELAILDVMLPDGSGLDLCRRLKNGAHAQMPVLMLSAESDVKTKVAGFEAGAIDYITKPFHRAEVMARVTTHLRLHASYRALVELQSLKLAQLASVQQTMLPQPQDMPAAKFHLCYKSLHEVGGDLCQVYALGSHLHDYVVADVSGHDVGAAMTTAALHALFRQNCSPLYSPNEALHTINRVATSLITSGQYITVSYARLNRRSNRLNLVGAGHPPPLLQKPDGSVRVLWLEGDVLGAFESPSFGVLDIAVQPGDRLYLLSDALVERDHRTDWQKGVEALAQRLVELSGRNLADTVGGLAESVLKCANPTDDITLIGTEV